MKKKLKLPKKLPKRPDFWNTSTPILVAHRGGDAAGNAKRNTLAAFKSSKQLGYSYFETDVINTKDNKVIVSHGAHTGLTARLRGTHTVKKLQSMNYEEVKEELNVNGEEIILLEDLLKTFPSSKFFIDPKTDAVVEPLSRLLLKTNSLDRVCAGSFYYSRVQKVHELLGDRVHLSLIVGRNIRITYPNLRMLKRGQLKYIEAVCIHHSYMSRSMINLIHGHGVKVLVWTANSPLSIKNALRCRVDGIISDKVALLKSIARD